MQGVSRSKRRGLLLGERARLRALARYRSAWLTETLRRAMDQCMGGHSSLDCYALSLWCAGGSSFVPGNSSSLASARDHCVAVPGLKLLPTCQRQGFPSRSGARLEKGNFQVELSFPSPFLATYRLARVEQWHLPTRVSQLRRLLFVLCVPVSRYVRLDSATARSLSGLAFPRSFPVLPLFLQAALHGPLADH